MSKMWRLIKNWGSILIRVCKEFNKLTLFIKENKPIFWDGRKKKVSVYLWKEGVINYKILICFRGKHKMK